MTETIATTQEISLNELWESTPTSELIFHPESLTNLPPAARIYLKHAIAPGTKLASAVRLWMPSAIAIGSVWRLGSINKVCCRRSSQYLHIFNLRLKVRIDRDRSKSGRVKPKFLTHLLNPQELVC